MNIHIYTHIYNRINLFTLKCVSWDWLGVKEKEQNLVTKLVVT